MLRSLIFAALLAAGPALAGDRIARHGDDEVRLYDSPCVSVEAQLHVPENERRDLKKAVGRFNGQTFFGCWRPMGLSMWIQWDDGDQGLVPQDALVPLLET